MSLLDGIPPILNGAVNLFGKAIEIEALATAFKDIVFGTQSRWGIYLPPKPPIAKDTLVLEVDGFLDFNVSNASQVAGYRIEQGQFASYNKVDSPYNINLTVIKNGTDVELTNFLSQIDTLSNDINLYKIVTPQQVYNNANILQYNYSRSADVGYNTLYVTITFVQILSTSETEFVKQTQTTSGQPLQSTGITSAK